MELFLKKELIFFFRETYDRVEHIHILFEQILNAELFEKFILVFFFFLLIYKPSLLNSFHQLVIFSYLFSQVSPKKPKNKSTTHRYDKHAFHSSSHRLCWLLLSLTPLPPSPSPVPFPPPSPFFYSLPLSFLLPLGTAPSTANVSAASLGTVFAPIAQKFALPVTVNYLQPFQTKVFFFFFFFIIIFKFTTNFFSLVKHRLEKTPFHSPTLFDFRFDRYYT